MVILSSLYFNTLSSKSIHENVTLDRKNGLRGRGEKRKEARPAIIEKAHYNLAKTGFRQQREDPGHHFATFGER